MSYAYINYVDFVNYKLAANPEDLFLLPLTNPASTTYIQGKDKDAFGNTLPSANGYKQVAFDINVTGWYDAYLLINGVKTSLNQKFYLVANPNFLAVAYADEEGSVFLDEYVVFDAITRENKEGLITTTIDAGKVVGASGYSYITITKSDFRAMFGFADDNDLSSVAGQLLASVMDVIMVNIELQYIHQSYTPVTLLNPTFVLVGNNVQLRFGFLLSHLQSHVNLANYPTYVAIGQGDFVYAHIIIKRKA
jgi:hypothetical protein